jgi:hypothetical protein
MPFVIGLFRKFRKVGAGRGVKNVFLGLWQQLCCKAKGKKSSILPLNQPQSRKHGTIKVIFPSGNRTWISGVTDGDTDPYTNKDWQETRTEKNK